MKKFFLVLLVSIFGICAFADDVDYEKIYRDTPVPKHTYIHDIDPGEFYDMQQTTWSPYPLFRLTAPLFFKSIAIEPGYYLLTPREHNGKWFMLFKVQGKVKYIIPVFDRQITPESFYKDNLEVPKTTWSQRVNIGFLDFVGTHFKSAKRKPEPQTYLEMFDLDNNFLLIILYWGNHNYRMVLRNIQL